MAEKQCLHWLVQTGEHPAPSVKAFAAEQPQGMRAPMKQGWWQAQLIMQEAGGDTILYQDSVKDFDGFLHELSAFATSVRLLRFLIEVLHDPVYSILPLFSRFWFYEFIINSRASRTLV